MELSTLKAKIYESVQFDEGRALMSAANTYMENPVALVDCSFHPLFSLRDDLPEGYGAWLDSAKGFLSQQLRAGQVRHANQHWIIRPIIVQNILIGHAAVCDQFHPLRAYDPELMDCIAKAAALQCSVYSQMIQVTDISPHAHRMLFDDLLDMQLPRATELDQRLKEIGWTAYEGLYVLNVWLRDIPNSAQFPMLQSSISQQINQVVPVYTYTYHFNQLVLLLCFGDVPEPAMTTEQTAALEQLLQTLNLKAGISRRMVQLQDANEAFAQAQMAVEMPKKLELEHHFHTYDSVALYHMIQISQSKIRDYHTFMHRAIPILQEHDRLNHQELLYTLHIYLEESKHTAQAAQRLCIHKNTLFYRLRKIRSLTGIDLESSEETLHLQISFLILRYDGFTFPK